MNKHKTLKTRNPKHENKEGGRRKGRGEEGVNRKGDEKSEQERLYVCPFAPKNIIYMQIRIYALE